MTCVSCGGPTRVLVAGGILPNKAPVHRCRSCGLDFIAAAPEDDYWGAAGQETIYSDEAVAEERSEFFRGILRTIATLEPKGTLLDIGAGKGEFALMASADGWEASVVEPSAAATQTLAAGGIREVFNSSIEDFSPERQYDCVTLLDLLEHTRDPRATIVKAASCLKAGGVLVVLTPDGGSIIRKGALLCAQVSRAFAGALKYQYYLPHVSYVSERWLRKAAASCGLTLAAVEHPATPRRFLLAKLRCHYAKYRFNGLFAAAVGAAYPVAKLGMGNKLLVYMRKAK